MAQSSMMRFENKALTPSLASVITLIRHGLIVLAIDGFDELAAEQGSTEALGALAYLLEQLEGDGTVVAASRRTFFDADDYLAGARLMGTKVAPFCEFDHLRLLDWTRDEGEELLRSFGMASPSGTYVELQRVLGDPSSPILTTPFLLAETAKALTKYQLEPQEWVDGMGEDRGGISGMVEAFLRREVHEKWKTPEGSPLLSFEQHMVLLSAIAEEMWMSQTERLDIQTLQLLASILFDDWEIEHDIRSSLTEMLRMHVFLVPVYEASNESRSFPHPEYQRFFEARALLAHLRSSIDDGSGLSLDRFLGTAQLPDVVARHCARMAHSAGLETVRLIEALGQIAGESWKPSSLLVSIGTLIPQLLNEKEGVEWMIDLRAIYPRMALESTILRDVVFRNGQFVRCSLRNVDWKNVQLIECELVEPVLDESRFCNVLFRNCIVNGATTVIGDEETTEYAPERIARLLQAHGITVQQEDDLEEVIQDDLSSTPGRKSLEKILRAYRRTTAMTESLIQTKFGQDYGFVIGKVLPLMEEYGIVDRHIWEGHGRPQGRWLLCKTREEILRSNVANTGMRDFWQTLDSLHH